MHAESALQRAIDGVPHPPCLVFLDAHRMSRASLREVAVEEMPEGVGPYGVPERPDDADRPHPRQSFQGKPDTELTGRAHENAFRLVEPRRARENLAGFVGERE